MKRASFVALSALLLSGCLNHGYFVSQQELVRLSQLPSEQRWQAIRVAQTAGSDDGPPSSQPYVSAPEAPLDPAESQRTPSLAATQTIIRVASTDSQALSLTPHFAPPLRIPSPPGSSFGPPGLHAASSLFSGGLGRTGSGTGSTPSSAGSPGNVGEAAVVLVAAAVVVGTVAVVAMGVALGTRYDGWLAVNPEEPVYVWTDQHVTPYQVPLSQLTPELAASAHSAMLYEIEDNRFYRVASAPLDRRGFGITAGILGGGFLLADTSVATGMGLHLNLGGNIANVVSLGLSLDTASASAVASTTAVFANVGPEIEVFPIRWLGFYGGAGYAYRNTYVTALRGTNVTSSEGFYARAGIEGEIPMFTRMGLRLRTGAVRWDYSGTAAYSWEFSAGIAVY